MNGYQNERQLKVFSNLLFIYLYVLLLRKKREEIFVLLVNPSYTEYDAKGRTVKNILPVDSEGSAPESTTEYLVADGGQETVATDPLGNRTVQVSDARGNIVYLERQDWLGKKLTSVNYSYDVIGQMLEAYNEDASKPIRVSYDLAGRMLTLSSKDSGEKHFFYDEAGNKVREDDSLLRSKGEQIKYEYDGMNRLVRIDYPESVDTVYEYGGANAGGNGAGKIIKTTDSTGTLVYKYGSLGEVVEETRSIYRMSANDGDGTAITATMSYVSDYLGRMQEITYPDGETVTYGYDAGGQVNRVSGVRGSYSFDYVDSITYDEYGQRAYIKYSNGAETYYTYDKARRWLSEIKTESRYRTIQNTKYSFDFVGNVLKTSDSCDLWRTTQSYEYDSLYQLVSAAGTTTYTANGITDYATSTYTQKFSFDSTGNMLTKVSTVKNSSGFTTKNRNSLSYDLTYAYDPGFAHRLSNVNGRYYGYDLNGNLVVEQDAPIGSLGDTSVLSPIVSERIGEEVYKEDYGWAVTNPDRGKNRKVVGSNIYQRTFIWDERNMLTQSSDSLHTVKYRYGADGQRTNKYSIAGDRGESIYFNKLWTWRRDSFTPNAGNFCKNIFLDKTRIVTKVRAADETSSADAHREYFYHGDHLQSATLITDYEGAVYERINYTPYGELWLEKSDNNGENYLPYRFTGKELDSETGLYYYGARYLDAKYSRWLSCDPALGEYMSGSDAGCGGAYNATNLSLYNYGNNNPVKYTDPDGNVIHAVVAAVAKKALIGGAVSASVDYGFQVAGNYMQGKEGADAWSDVNVGEVAGAFVSGALTTVGIGAVTKVAGSSANAVVRKCIQVAGNTTVSAAASVPETITKNAVNNLVDSDNEVSLTENLKDNAIKSLISGFAVSLLAPIPKQNVKTPSWYEPNDIPYKQVGANKYVRKGPMPGTVQAGAVQLTKDVLNQAFGQGVSKGVSNIYDNVKTREQSTNVEK